MKYKLLSLTALFSAIISVLSPITLSFGPVPFSLASFLVYITSLTLGKRGVISVIVYLCLGAIGLPVFSGFRGGLDLIFGPLGGFIFGFVLCALIIGVIKDKFGFNKLRLTLALIFGTLAIYTFGVIQYMFITKTPFLSAVAVCVLPFIVIDTIKIILALNISLKLGKIKLFER